MEQFGWTKCETNKKNHLRKTSKKEVECEQNAREKQTHKKHFILNFARNSCQFRAIFYLRINKVEE